MSLVVEEGNKRVGFAFDLIISRVENFCKFCRFLSTFSWLLMIWNVDFIIWLFQRGLTFVGGSPFFYLCVGWHAFCKGYSLVLKRIYNKPHRLSMSLYDACSNRLGKVLDTRSHVLILKVSQGHNLPNPPLVILHVLLPYKGGRLSWLPLFFYWLHTTCVDIHDHLLWNVLVWTSVLKTTEHIISFWCGMNQSRSIRTVIFIWNVLECCDTDHTFDQNYCAYHFIYWTDV